MPCRPNQEAFNWLAGGTDIPQGATWYIDGSLFDEARSFARRTGFGVVVVSEAGQLVACGNGIPPAWVKDAAGAELWAFYVVLRMNAEVPRVVTDCLGILEALRGSPQNAAGPSKMLARTWGMIASTLDGSFYDARVRTVWMPAHQPSRAIGCVKDSNGKPITSIMWRANRLVDVLAKNAASKDRLPKWVVCKAANAAKLVQHHAARIGYVTHAANNHTVQVSCSTTGSMKTIVVRDSSGARPAQKRRLRAQCLIPSGAAEDPQQQTFLSPQPSRTAAPGSPEGAQGMRCCKQRRPQAAATPADAGRQRKRAAIVHAECLREEVADEERVARWLERLQLKPSSDTLSAHERFEKLRDRVRQRQLEARLPEE